MSNRPPRWLITIIVLISVPLLLPFLYVIERASNVGLSRSISLLWRSRIWELLSNTLLLMVFVTLFSIILGTLCAFLLERYHFFGKRFFQVTMALPLCIPAFVSCFTWISLTFKVEGFWGTIGIMTLSSFPLAYIPVSSTLKRLDHSLEEISLSLAKNQAYTFWHAVFPQLKPAIGSSILLISLHMLVEFGAVSILNYQTFTTAIFQEYEMAFDNNTSALLSGVLMFICIIVVIGEISFRGTQTLYQNRKGIIRPYPLKILSAKKQIIVISFFSIIFAFSIGVPITMLIYWLKVGNSIEGTLDFSEFFTAFINSLTISTIGASLTVICAFPLVWAAVRYRSRLTIWIDRIPYILHAVPGLVIALSLIFYTINYAYAFYQTFVMVIVAYFILYLPMAQTTLRSSLEQISDNIEKIGQSLGRSNFYIFRTLVIPAMLPGIASAFALVFLNLMKELTATLLLTPNDIKTLSTAVWEYTSDAQYAAATPYAIMLVLFSGIPVFLLKKYSFK